MTTRTLLVGCGRLGLRVGELLLADQDERGRHEVLGLRRDPSSLPPGFVPVAADLSAALPTPLPRVVMTRVGGVLTGGPVRPQGGGGVDL